MSLYVLFAWFILSITFYSYRNKPVAVVTATPKFFIVLFFPNNYSLPGVSERLQVNFVLYWTASFGVPPGIEREIALFF